MIAAGIAPLIQEQIYRLRYAIESPPPTEFRYVVGFYYESQREYLETLERFLLDNAVIVGPAAFCEFRLQLASLKDDVGRMCAGGEE